MAQVEIKTPLAVLDGLGRPGNFGWSRLPLFEYDPNLIRASRGLINESDRYIIFSSTHLFIFEILDGGCLGYIGISVISIKDKQRTAQIFTASFPLGLFEMPANSETGSLKIQRKKGFINFITREKGVRIIKIDIPKLGHQRRLRGEVVLFEPPGAQSIVTNMPWRRERDAFRCSRRSPWYIVEGVMQFGTSEVVFTRGNAWGIFDWNRGVRPHGPHGDIRYWAAACGACGVRQVGFSIGYGSADSGQGTENAFFLDGKLHKLDQVTFHISPANWLLPWHFTSNDNRLDMILKPYQEWPDQNRMLFHSLKRRQVCGFFTGKVILDDGSPLEFQNINGFAERRKTRF
ncbi:MAG: DUF2804 domain-containing protein [Spirochaetaceae bacterium]|jgi:hypothetical protein|nr:DUF2804 domain-containing protein [Spirochaetaceae bacterium]